MGRKKTKMELIREDKARMLAFQKRKATLLKKASEFSVLCGVDTCVIIFGPKQDDQPVTAVTWPSNPEEVMRIINKYSTRDKPGICIQVSNYFADKKKKVDVDLAKLQGPIFKAKHPAWDDRLNSFSVDQLKLLRGQLEAKLRIVGEKISMLKVNRYVMDKGTGWMQAEASSQLSPSQNFSYDMENYTRRSQFDIDSSRYSAKDLGFFADPKPFDVQMRSSFQPEQSSHMTTSVAPFLLERNNNSIIYPTDLQLFPETKPLHVLPPVHYQTEQSTYESPLLPILMEDASSMDLFCNQNHGYQFGCTPSGSNSQYTSRNILSNANPTPWIWDNALFSNADQPSVSYVAPSMWPIPPYKQFPMPSFPQQMRFSEGNDQFNGSFPHQMRFSEAKENDDAEFKRTDQYYK